MDLSSGLSGPLSAQDGNDLPSDCSVTTPVRMDGHTGRLALQRSWCIAQ